MAFQKGHQFSNKTIENLRKSHIGKQHSLETKKKMSKNHRHYQTKDTKIKISKTLKGRIISIETKSKMKLAKQHISEEARKNMRIARFEYIKKICGILYPNIGHNEKQILDDLEIRLNIKILRQYKVEGYFLDGYIPELNLAIEIDERPKNKQKDIERQKLIESKLGCKFLRIKDYD